MPLVTIVCVALVVVPLLLACSLNSATPTPRPTPTSGVAATPGIGRPGAGTPPVITLPTGNDLKLDSKLLDVADAFRQGGQAAAEQKARETGLLDSTTNELRLTLVLTDTNTQPVADKVKALGGKVANSYENLIDILVPLDLVLASLNTNNQSVMQELAGLTTVREVRVTPLPRPEGLAFPAGATLAEVQPLIAALAVEGVAASGADKWQAAGYKGKGIKIGIIDAGFGGYLSLLGKELPAKVNLQSFRPDKKEGSEIHGTAVAEIVAAMAPEAELYLSPIYGDASYAQAVKYLVDEAKVQIIQQSQGWHDTRGDGSGFRAEQVNYARDKGVLYVKSAGNEADAHYTATFSPDANNRHQFAPGKDRLRVEAQNEDNVILLYLTWDAWSPGAAVNYDLYLFDEAGTRVASSRNVQGTQKTPYEYIEYSAKPGVKYYAAIEAVGQQRAVRLDLFGKNTALETVQGGSTPSGSISNPGDARGSFTVGAADYKSGKLESYSGQGPTLDGRRKPDLTGLAGVTTAAYKNQPFYGTSAAAPHVSGAAALVFGAQPGATAAQVQAFLEQKAQDMADPGPENKTGFGRLNLGPAEQATTPVQPTGSSAPGSPPFADTFDNPQSGLPNEGETTYAGGRYLIAPNAANRAAWATYGYAYGNATVEATVQLTAPGGGLAGLVFWQSSASDYSTFNISADGFFQVVRLQGGRWATVVPWTKSAAIVANGPNKLAAQINGPQVALLVNGQTVGTAQAPAAGVGKVGLIAATFAQPGASATFTDFKVTPAP